MNGATVLTKFTADTKDFDDKVKSVSSKVGSIAKGIGTAFAAGTAIATAAITKMVSDSVKEFSNYEQLMGGVETLFGTGSASNIEEYAEMVGKSIDEIRKEYDSLNAAQETVAVNAWEAYKSAGLSVNEYMETVTSFSAALKQSINDPVKMAKAADQAVTDMADNANKMGTSMEMIQSAYQGFAKQNYTMLDNLKLGYGGTKTEMERLLADATKLTGVKYDIENLGDVYEAIHVIQTELGITGTTAKEASSTIQGSAKMMKSSFKNLLTTLATGEGLEEGLNQLIEAVMIFGDNLMPVIEKVLESIAKMIPQLVDKIVAILPGLIQRILPSLMQGVISLINGLIVALPTLISTLLPPLLEGLIEITKQIIIMLPEIITMLAEMLPSLLPQIIDAILSIIPLLLDNLPLFINAGFQLLGGIIAGIINAVPSLIMRAIETGAKLLEAFKEINLIDIGVNLIKGLWNGILSMKDWIVEKVKGIGSSIVKSIKSVFGVKSPSTVFADIGGNLVQGLWNGMQGIKDWVIGKVKGLGNSILSGMKKVLGIKSPSKEFAIIGRYSVLGYTEALESMDRDVKDQIAETFSLSPQLSPTNSMHFSPNIVNNNYVDVQQDPLGQMVSNIKTFSGGAKNDYNYGAGV